MAFKILRPPPTEFLRAEIHKIGPDRRFPDAWRCVLASPGYCSRLQSASPLQSLFSLFSRSRARRSLFPLLARASVHFDTFDIFLTFLAEKQNPLVRCYPINPPPKRHFVCELLNDDTGQQVKHYRD